MSESWYSAADMQLFVLSPLFIYPLWRWPRSIGPALVLAGLLVGHCYSFVMYKKWNISLFLIFSRKYLLFRPMGGNVFNNVCYLRSSFKKVSEYFQSYYAQTLNRLAPYLVGILLGWILNRTRNLKLVIQKV